MVFDPRRIRASSDFFANLTRASSTLLNWRDRLSLRRVCRWPSAVYRTGTFSIDVPPFLGDRCLSAGYLSHADRTYTAFPPEPYHLPPSPGPERFFRVEPLSPGTFFVLVADRGRLTRALQLSLSCGIVGACFPAFPEVD